MGFAHLAAAMLFMWQTGTRVSETARVLPEHVDLRGRIVLLEQTKTSQWERRHISHELMIRIANLPMQRWPADIWLRVPLWPPRPDESGLPPGRHPFVPPHQAGRHSFASNALAMGATAKEVMEAGGWKTARMVLETYAHANEAGRSIADRFDAELAQSQNRNQPSH